METPGDEPERHFQAGLQLEACREGPLLQPNQEDYHLDLTTTGMKKELQAMKGFGVHDEVRINGMGDNYDRGALPTMWAKRPKGTEIT